MNHFQRLSLINHCHIDGITWSFCIHTCSRLTSFFGQIVLLNQSLKKQHGALTYLNAQLNPGGNFSFGQAEWKYTNAIQSCSRFVKHATLNQTPFWFRVGHSSPAGSSGLMWHSAALCSLWEPQHSSLAPISNFNLSHHCHRTQLTQLKHACPSKLLFPLLC